MIRRIVRKLIGFTTGEGHIKRSLSWLTQDDAMNKQVNCVLNIGLPV